jgi:hypothetical protein
MPLSRYVWPGSCCHPIIHLCNHADVRVTRVGDLRVVTAIDRPELRHLLNVVVLNVDPVGPSLSVACSGGDLDGDMFSCIWYSPLVPPKSHEISPMDYGGIAERAKLSAPPVHSSAEEFFVRVLSNECLGRVAHMHLALCDQLPLGALDVTAIALAEAQSLAVDYPKTMVPPQVPKNALDMINENGYPDFMEKKQSYSSDKLIGLLYRKCKSFSFDRFPGRCDCEHFIDEDFLRMCPGDAIERFRAQAAESLRIYILSARRLMSRFRLVSEAELFLCESVRWNSHLSRDKGRAKAALTSSWTHLKRRMRGMFFGSDSSVDEFPILLWARAVSWYVVAYEKYTLDDQAGLRDIVPFWGFPWILSDIFSSIKVCAMKQRLTVKAMPPRSFAVDIGKSSFAHWSRDLDRVHAVVARGEYTLDLVRQAMADVKIPAKCVEAYGSHALYLCEFGSEQLTRPLSLHHFIAVNARRPHLNTFLRQH